MRKYLLIAPGLRLNPLVPPQIWVSLLTVSSHQQGFDRKGCGHQFGQNTPILEVLKNAWIVFRQPCHFCLIYRHKSCIVLFIICKAPWIEQANRMEMQQPISLPRCSMPTGALQGQHRTCRKLQDPQCWGEAGPDTQ